MKTMLTACCLAFLIACQSDNTDSKLNRLPAPEGFLNTPWGTKLSALQSPWRLQPTWKEGDLTMYKTNISTFGDLSVGPAMAMFRKGALVGIVYVIPNDSLALQFRQQSIALYGTAYKEGAVPSPEGTTETIYQWDTGQSRLLLMHIENSSSYAFLLKSGVGLPLSFLLRQR